MTRAAPASPVEDHMVTGRTVDSRGGQIAMHRLDDVAALAHPPQRRLHLRHDPPHAWRGLFRQAHVLQRPQPSHAHGVPPRIALRFGGKPQGSLIRVAQDGTIEPGEPLGADFIFKLAQ